MPTSRTMERETLDARELRLLRLLLRGQTVGEAAEALHLAPDAGREILADLMRRHGTASPRRLLTRALVYGWIR